MGQYIETFKDPARQERRTVSTDEEVARRSSSPLRSFVPHPLRYSFPWFYLLLALALRVFLVMHTHGVIDGDEALTGLQAMGILHGDRPVYFYNQSYMGSLEAYFVAALFAVFGSSAWTLRAEAILLSLIIVWLTWRLAACLAEHARLPAYARQWFMNVAALLAAVPPLYDTVAELRALGGYIETFLFMLLLLLSVLRLTERWRTARALSQETWDRERVTTHEMAWRWAGIGLIVGLGLWTDPLIVSALLAAALWIAWNIFVQRVAFARLLPAIAAIPTAIIGLAPALVWGAAHRWTNVTYLVSLGSKVVVWPELQARYPDRLSLARGITTLYKDCVAPRVIGGSLPGEDSLLTALHSPTLYMGVASIAITGILVSASLLPHRPLLLVQIRRLVALPLLFAACTAFMFCATTTAAPGLLSCNYDVTGRYATPLLLALPFLCAAAFTLVILLLGRLYENTAGRPARRERGQHTPLFIQGMLLASLLVVVYTQVWTYRAADPGLTFQSPYCSFAPANNDQLIAYMQHEHIRYAWANNWIADPLLFKTHGSITVADPIPLLRHVPLLDRFPAYTNAVQHADRASIITITLRVYRYPLLLKILDKQGITYRVARFPSEPGVDILVVTPLNHTVYPFKSMVFYGAFLCLGL
ncbi:MAG: hypothetical protein H0W02_06405 [Ktedonobacteraceae bacterium]|nr:hypothetical protein [Ktedonobacteraceae bacterium]